MTKTIREILNLSVFTLVVLSISLPFIFQGCATQSPLFSSRNDKASLIIEKPPTRIIISGEYKDIDVNEIIRIMKELRKQPFHRYRFEDSISIDSNHITTSTENINSNYKRK